MPRDNRSTELWIARLQALGRAQSRSWWVLLVTGFFFAVVITPSNPTPADEVAIPLIDMPLSIDVVATAGPAIISFLMLWLLGALRAYTAAREVIGRDETLDSEALDVTPNAFELAAYTRANNPLRHVLFFAYPLALTLFALESIMLLQGTRLVVRGRPGLQILYVTSLILTVFAGLGVVWMWFRRGQRKVRELNGWLRDRVG